MNNCIYYYLDVFHIQMDPEWEIERDCLDITETLGEGAFGVVVKATAVGLSRCDENHEEVAVKMLKGMFFLVWLLLL